MPWAAATLDVDRRAMLVNYFAILLALLLISGLVVDAGLLEWRQVQLQIAADAAAEEASFQLARGDSNWSSQAQTQAAANGATNGSLGVTVALANPPTTGAYAGDGLAVQATVSKSVNNLFMALVNGGKSTIGANAVARQVPTCLWITSGTLQLASATFNASCGAYVGTSTGTSLLVDYFSRLRTWRTRVVGPASGGLGSSGVVAPAPHFISAVKSDPLAYVNAPASTFSCTYNAAAVTGITITIGPANFCGGVTISNSNVTLTPGLYIVADGMTVINSTITATSGVTFYFTKRNSSSYAGVNFNSSYFYIKAPTTAAYGGISGVAVFADRSWVTHGSQGLNFVSSTVVTDGVWYSPNTGIYSWLSPFSCYKYIILCVDNVYFFGTTSTFGVNFTDFSGVSPLHYDDGVLVE